MFNSPSRLDSLLGESYLLQRCSQCILQPQATGLFVGGVLPLCRDAVNVFYSPKRLDSLLGESYPSAEMQSMYSTAPSDWTLCWGSLTPLQRCSQCILQPQATGLFVGGVLPLCRDAVNVFYSPKRLDSLLGESYPSAEMQSMYSTAPSDWTLCWGSLTPLQRCSQCILQPQATGLFVGGVLPLCRDAVNVFYSPKRLDSLLGESYPSAEMQSVYSTAPTNLATYHVLFHYRYHIKLSHIILTLYNNYTGFQK